MNIIHVAASAAIACIATAQQLTITAATPLVVSAQNAGSTTSQTLPAGPLAPLGHINASASGGAAGAHATWDVGTTPVALSVRLWHMAVVAPQATAPASASAGPHEYLLHLSSPSPRNMLVRGHRWFDLLPGSPLPLVEVDVLDDGSSEFVVTSTATGPNLPIAAVSVGPLPIAIRVRVANVASMAGTLGSSFLHLEATPNNDLDITQVVIGCSTASLQCHPSFVGTGVDFWFNNLSVIPCVLVLGLGLQPVVLPAYFGVPCILAPTPDFVVLAGTSSTLPFTLPLPPAVRPVTVYGQVVHLSSPLLVTDGFRIGAF